MSKNWGGPRKGAGRKPVVRFLDTRIAHGDNVVIERGRVDELPSSPEMWQLVSVSNGYIELQREIEGTSEVMTISTVDFWNS